jgi:protein SCO1
MINWKQFVFAGLIISILISCHSESGKHTLLLPYYSSAEFTPHWLSVKDADTIHSIPNFSFIDQDGQTITRNTFDNKITAVNFFFTRCPGICKKLTNNLLSVQSAFKEDNNVLLLSHSVTPESDSIAVLKKYAEEYKIISGKWHLVTGNRNEIYNIARKAYFADEDMGWKQDSTTFLHTENILLIDKKHHIRGVYKGTLPSDVNNLIADIKTLEKE